VRVLMVMGNLEAGGAEIAALNLTRGLTRRGCRITVAALRGGDVLGERFRQAGAQVYRGLAHWRFDPLPAARLAGIIRRHRIDCIVIVNALRNGLVYAALAAMSCGREVPTICMCQAVPGRQAGRFCLRLRAGLAAGTLDAVVCVSRFQRRLLAARGVPPRRMPVIRNGIELERFEAAAPADLPLPAGKRIITQVANVMPDKDYATLIAAAADLAGKRDDVHFLFVGRGTDSPAMAEAVHRAGLDGAVTLAGHRPDIPGILAATDLFVLATRSESFGLVVAEAMAAGVPVIASDVPAFSELFADSREALMERVPPGDAGALAGAMQRLLEEPARRQALSAAARRHVRKFSRDRMARNYLRLMERLVRSRSRRRPGVPCESFT